MAGIEITDEMTSEQLEAMTGGEQLKAEVNPLFFSFYSLTKTLDTKIYLPMLHLSSGHFHHWCDSLTRVGILARSGTPRSLHSA